MTFGNVIANEACARKGRSCDDSVTGTLEAGEGRPLRSIFSLSRRVTVG